MSEGEPRPADEPPRDPNREERLAHLWVLESLDRINRAAQAACDLEQMMRDVLDTTLDVFDCDRAQLLYPCDPRTPSWRATMVRTRPQWPSALLIGVDVPSDPSMVAAMDSLLASSGPVTFGPGSEHPLPAPGVRLAAQSVAATAVRPRLDRPYMLGLHQCSYPRVWKPEEMRLLGEIGRRVEDALTSLTAFRQVQESELRYREVFENASDILSVYAVTADGRFRMLDANAAWERMFGRSRDSTIGTCLDEHAANPNAGKALIVFRRCFESRSPAEIDQEIVTPSGRSHMRGTVIPVMNAAGEIYRILGVGRDVTEQVRAEERFHQAQKMEAVGRLAGGVAHDFNNLLTVMNGYSDLILQRLAPDDAHHELLTEIKRAGERAARLTSQLLAFSRKQVLSPRIVDVNELLFEILKLLQRLIGEDIELLVKPGRSLGLAKIDPGHFEQAIINLAVNARDAMPRGGRLIIETRDTVLDEAYAERHAEVKPGPYVLVAVTDSGHGMDEATRARIFEPFFTTKGPGQGTGLGLAMVYGFVKQSGGHIDASSELHRGTTFHLYLPRADECSSSDSPAPAPVAIPARKETILVVEDEASVRRLLRRLLGASGFTVLEGRDGEEALTVARDHEGPIHLLLTDIVMPRMSGAQLAETLTRLRPSLRVLFMSGYTDEAVLRHGVLEGSVAFLQKPFNPSSLAEKIREVLEGGERPATD